MGTKMRIQNANVHISSFVKEGEQFYIGLLFEDFVKCNVLSKYNLPTFFSNGNSYIPSGKGPATKVNVNGKYVRKQPEEKVEKLVHINYDRKDGIHIEYDRIYNVFAKDLLHKYNISLTFHTNKHGQNIVTTDRLVYDTSENSNIKNTHAINVFCEIFNDYEVFTSEFEPAIHFNKRFEKELLPHGTLKDDETFDEIVRVSGHYCKNEADQKAFQKRLHILKGYDPDIRGKGPNNFYGYIVFGFSNLDIVLLESMYSENATYVFKLEDYENNIIKDKQTLKDEKKFLKRFCHYDNWETKIKSFLNKKNEENKNLIPFAGRNIIAPIA